MGIKKNARLYVPYLLSCAFMTAMLYVIAFLAVTPALCTINGKMNGSGTSAVAMTMAPLVRRIGVHRAVSLLHEQLSPAPPQEEFGLYSVLGMDRGALSAILFWETLLAAAFTLIAGAWLGLLLSYVSQSALLRLLSLPHKYAFGERFAAIKQCAITFIAIFALLYVRGVLSLRHAQGAALLKRKTSAKKPPKSQWLLVIPGIALLLGAYYIAATINDPVAAILFFFLAVIMVILSTYLLSSPAA